jgi:hypothetical protein
VKLKTRHAKLVTVITSIAISLIILEYGARIFYRSARIIPTSEDLIKYDSFGLRNHHIRDLIKNTGERRIPNTYYYSTYKLNGRGGGILIQGDSWMEMLDNHGKLENELNTWSDFSFLINGGTSSYAPSAMEVQYNDILKQTNGHIEVVVAYIDQSDFMDEVCRYNKLRVEDARGDLLAILKDSSLTGPIAYNQNRNLNLGNIEASPSKLFAMINNALQINFFDPARKNAFKNRDCTWNDIQRFMKGEITSEEVGIFKKNLSSLIRSYQRTGARVILITHKHRRHFEGVYIRDIFDYVEDVAKKFDDVEVYDLTRFKSNSISQDRLDEIFPTFEMDVASHPHKKYFQDRFSPYISSLIKDKVNKIHSTN